jgi:eukaryotic-like serine/threonine-protein kinase
MGADPRDRDTMPDPAAGERAHRSAHRPRLRPDDVLGRYTILGLIGAGGMGEVYRARDPQLERDIAVKVLPRAVGGSSLAARSRFLREAQALARLNHPNVVAVYDVGTVDDQVFVAMELVAGVPLVEWMRARRSWREVRDVFIAAGRGLAAAHAAGIIHRDFKPHNVMVGDARVVVLDFGLARRGDELVTPPEGSAEAVLAVPLTRTGDVLGTPGYMSLEQLEGRPAGERSDQFSFCASLFEALFGRLPHDGDTVGKLIQARRHPVVPPATPRHPRWLTAQVLRGLEADPEARHPSMESLLAALLRDPAARRRRWMAAAAAIVAGGAVVAGLAGARTASCGGSARRLRGAWDDPVRQAVKRAFLATGRAHAEKTYTLVAERLDEYARGLAAMDEESCRATRIEGRQSDTLMDLRTACLDGRRATLAALTSLWRGGVDDQALAHALDASTSLPPLSECADPRALTERAPLPPGAAERARIRAVRDHLDGARALIASERWTDARGQAQAARIEADAAGWVQVRAEAAFVLGRVLARQGDPDAEAMLTDASALAGKARDDRLEAHSLITLVGHLANSERSADRSLLLARVAEGVVERSGGGDELFGLLGLARSHGLIVKGKLDDAEKSLLDARRRLDAALDPADIHRSDVVWTLAHVLDERGDYAGAKKLLEAEQRRLSALLGPDHPSLAVALMDLGNVQDDLDDYTAAIDSYKHALAILEKSFGAGGLPVAAVLENLATSEENLERLDDATRHMESARDIRVRALGPDHALVGQVLCNLGGLLRLQDRLDEALAAAQRGLAILEKAMGDGDPQLAYALDQVADVLYYRGDLDGAAAHYQRAMEIRRKAYGAGNPEGIADEVALGNIRCRQKRYREAVPLLESAWAQARNVPDPARKGRSAASYGHCLVEVHRPATKILEEALELSQAGHEPTWALAGIHFDHARALLHAGSRAAAVAEAEEAEATLAHSPSLLARRDLDEMRRFPGLH